MPNNDRSSDIALPEGAFDGRRAFHAHLRAALTFAARQNWREIVFSDPDFVDWPLGERDVADALQAWSKSGRSFVMLAQRFTVFEREHARFVHWRRMWSHIVVCRACDAPGLPPVPSGIWTPSWFLLRIDPAQGCGVCGAAPAPRREFRERLDECLRRGRPAFAASTLGL